VLTNNFQYYHSYLDLPGDDMLWLLYHEGRTTISELLNSIDMEKFNNIFLIDQEINLEHMPNNKIHIWQPVVNNNPRSHTFLWWFQTVKELHEKCNLTDRLVSHNAKTPEFKFDMLLGTPREHKDFVFDQITTFNIIDDFIIGCYKANNDRTEDRGNWVSGGDYEHGIGAKFGNELIAPEVSQCILPYDIYNNSWYTVVCETSYDHCFFTEKTAKPILGKRLFVLIGAKHMIKNLQSLGYKTFSDIIDESYDEVDDNEIRWGMACHQIEELYARDPIEVYSHIQDVLEHNYQLITQTDWWDKVKYDIEGIKR
jgi:hypothetical protein